MKKILNCDPQQLMHNALLKGMASVFEAATKLGIDLVWFTKKFLKSYVFDDYFDDPTIFSQSPYYVIELFSEECTEPRVLAQYKENDIAYWFGCLFACFRYNKNQAKGLQNVSSRDG